MPEVVSWLSRIPEAIYEIERGEQEGFARADIERLLDIKGRRAQGILSAAGASKEGKAFVVHRDDLVLYLKVVGKEVLEEEQRRRRRFSEKLTIERQKFLKEPRLIVGLKPDDVAIIKQRGLRALPPGITLEPGRIVVAGFTTGDEALRCLMGLALAIAKDQDEFERLVSQSEKGAS